MKYLKCYLNLLSRYNGVYRIYWGNEHARIMNALPTLVVQIRFLFFSSQNKRTPNFSTLQCHELSYCIFPTSRAPLMLIAHAT